MPGIIKEIANAVEMPRLSVTEGTELVPAMTALGTTVAIPVSLMGGGGSVRREIVETSVSRVLSAADENKAIHAIGASDVTLTVPSNATAAIPVGAEFELARIGTGGATISGVSGVLINGTDAGTASISGQWQTAVLRKIDTNEWLVIGGIGSALSLPTYTWDDVFKDQTANGGEDWSGWGVSMQTVGGVQMGGEVPLEWFLHNIIPAEAPDGAIVDLTTATGNSPSGVFFLADRMQAMPTSLARNVTIDLTGNVVSRSEGSNDWGQFFLWGVKVQDPSLSNEGVIGADSSEGDTILYMRNDPNSDALLAAAVPGAIIELRTNTTAPNYHGDDERATCFVQSVNTGSRTITVQEPLPIDVPESNPVDSWDGATDPSTVTLLQGSQLSANAPSGGNTIVMNTTLGLQAGDWLVVATTELPGFVTYGPDAGTPLNQFVDGIADPNQVGPDIDITYPEDYGGAPVYINEEMMQIASISGNTVTLRGTLGKNKLTAWGAYAFKVDPIENLTIKGGNWRGAKNNGGEPAWKHCYLWCRYMVNCTVRDAFFDDDTGASDALRRTGQACRYDTGDNNVMDNLWIGRPGSISAGEGYGVSMRKGEKNSIVRNIYTEGCRHSIEFWATSGGCIAEDNECADDTSSSIDTHGNWNTGIIIRRNLVTRDRNSAAVSPDLGANEATDAIRIGNNKFMFDENIQVLDNYVTNYDGNALSIVPGCWDVTVDGLTIDGCWRIMNMKRNSRHTDLFMRNILVQNVSAINLKDRWLDIRHVGHSAGVHDRMQGKDVVLKNWTIGATGPSSIPSLVNPIPGEEVTGMYFLHTQGLRLENWTITDAEITNDNWLMILDEIDDVDIVNFNVAVKTPGGSDKFLNINNATNVEGEITVTGLNPPQGGGDPFLLYFNEGTGYPSTTKGAGLTINHDLGPSPKTLDVPASGFTLNLVEIP